MSGSAASHHMNDPRDVAVSVVGPVEWQSAVSGFCRCPGESLHTHKTGKKDCRVNVDGAGAAGSEMLNLPEGPKIPTEEFVKRVKALGNEYQRVVDGFNDRTRRRIVLEKLDRRAKAQRIDHEEEEKSPQQPSGMGRSPRLMRRRRGLGFRRGFVHGRRLAGLGAGNQRELE